MPVLGGDGLEGIQDAGALAEGVYLSSPTSPRFRAMPTGGSSRRSARSTTRRPQPAGRRHLRRDLSAARRDREGGLEPRAACAAALAGVGSVSAAFEGVTGTIAFDANGDVPNQNVYIGLVQNGAVTVVNGVEETVMGAR